MRAVIQRVTEASVEINTVIKGRINSGFLVLLGIEEQDTAADIDWLSQKIVNMRVFSDEAGLMNRSILETGGEILLISQFTLYAQTKKGNRPSFIRAAKPEKAIPLYQSFIESLEIAMGKPIQTGEFGADMKVQLVNDGPVTIMMDTREKDLF